MIPLLSKIGPKTHPKYDWMCKPVIVQRCCTRFDFLGAKLCGPCYECTKKFAKIC
jgi:hypothetical protein